MAQQWCIRNCQVENEIQLGQGWYWWPSFEENFLAESGSPVTSKLTSKDDKNNLLQKFEVGRIDRTRRTSAWLTLNESDWCGKGMPWYPRNRSLKVLNRNVRFFSTDGMPALMARIGPVTCKLATAHNKELFQDVMDQAQAPRHDEKEGEPMNMHGLQK